MRPVCAGVEELRALEATSDHSYTSFSFQVLMDRSLSHSLSRAALALGFDSASCKEQERATAL
eukprot:8373243-Prorocentrum_lima.AAC.1